MPALGCLTQVCCQNVTQSLRMPCRLNHATDTCCSLHVFFGCYHNLFRLMAKCGVLQNLLLKEHTHTFVNTGELLHKGTMMLSQSAYLLSPAIVRPECIRQTAGTLAANKAVWANACLPMPLARPAAAVAVAELRLPLQVEMYGGLTSVSFLVTRRSVHLSMG